jgi:glycerophosphoryl diester phosphodiesterase
VAAGEFFDHPGPIAFAHRGGVSDAPENTLAAFARAVDLGYRYLETDVHATKDGRLVAFHDASLTRVAGRPDRIADLTWSELRQVRIAGEPIPLLEEILATWPHARVNIDVKAPAAVAALARTLTAARAHSRVCVGSFSQTRLRRFRAHVGDRVATALGPVEAAWLRMRGGMMRASALAGRAAQVPASVGRVPFVTARFVEVAHSLDLHVHVWTIDDPDEMRRLLDLGVDGIFTDRTDVLKAVLVERGQWA